MKSSTVVIVAIGVIIGLALTPVISNSVGRAAAPPTCAGTLTAVRATAGGTPAVAAPTSPFNTIVLVTGNVYCESTTTAGTPGAADSWPLTAGGRLNSLYVGTPTSLTTAPQPGPLVAAGTIVGLIPLAYIFAILILPVGMIGKRYLRRA